MDRSRSDLTAVKCVSIDLNLVLHRIRCKLMLRCKLGYCCRCRSFTLSAKTTAAQFVVCLRRDISYLN